MVMVIININERKQIFLCRNIVELSYYVYTICLFILFIGGGGGSLIPVYAFGHVLAILLSCFICCIFQLPTIGGITKKRRQFNPILNAMQPIVISLKR